MKTKHQTTTVAKKRKRWILDRIQVGPNKPSQRGDGTDVQGQRRSRREASRRAGPGRGWREAGSFRELGLWLRSVSDVQGVSGWLGRSWPR